MEIISAAASSHPHQPTIDELERQRDWAIRDGQAELVDDLSQNLAEVKTVEVTGSNPVPPNLLILRIGLPVAPNLLILFIGLSDPSKHPSWTACLNTDFGIYEVVRRK